jgi:hypothetical protein
LFSFDVQDESVSYFQSSFIEESSLDGCGVARLIISFKTAASRFKSCRVDIIEGFFPNLLSLSAATDSIVRLINGYESRTASNCPESNEYKLQYVTQRTPATRLARVNKQISKINK